VQHETFEFPVIGAAPVRPGKERPADLDLIPLLVIAVVSRGPDDLVVVAVNDGQRALGIQGVLKEALENLFLVSIFVRVLFPDERVCGDGIHVSKIFLAERSEFEESALQTRLEVKWHLENPKGLRCADGCMARTRRVVKAQKTITADHSADLRKADLKQTSR